MDTNEHGCCEAGWGRPRIEDHGCRYLILILIVIDSDPDFELKYIVNVSQGAGEPPQIALPSREWEWRGKPTDSFAGQRMQGVTSDEWGGRDGSANRRIGGAAGGGE